MSVTQFGSDLLRDSSLVQETKTKQALKDHGNRLPSVFVAENGECVFLHAKNFLHFHCSLLTFPCCSLGPVRNSSVCQSMGLSAVGRQC